MAVPDLDLQAFAPTRARAQRVARAATLPLLAAVDRVGVVPPGQLRIHKVGVAGLPVTGARFEVRPVEGGDVPPRRWSSRDLVIGPDGTVGPFPLPGGSYVVTEVAPPPGYQLAEPQTVAVTAGRLTEVEVVDLRCRPPPPRPPPPRRRRCSRPQRHRRRPHPRRPHRRRRRARRRQHDERPAGPDHGDGPRRRRAPHAAAHRGPTRSHGRASAAGCCWSGALVATPPRPDNHRRSPVVSTTRWAHRTRGRRRPTDERSSSPSASARSTPWPLTQLPRAGPPDERPTAAAARPPPTPGARCPALAGAGARAAAGPRLRHGHHRAAGSSTPRPASTPSPTSASTATASPPSAASPSRGATHDRRHRPRRGARVHRPPQLRAQRLRRVVQGRRRRHHQPGHARHQRRRRRTSSAARPTTARPVPLRRRLRRPDTGAASPARPRPRRRGVARAARRDRRRLPGPARRRLDRRRPRAGVHARRRVRGAAHASPRSPPSSACTVFVHGRYSDDVEPGTNADTLAEILQLARDTGAACTSSTSSPPAAPSRWPSRSPRSQAAVADEGIDVTACMYPYDYWATYLGSARFADGLAGAVPHHLRRPRRRRHRRARHRGDLPGAARPTTCSSPPTASPRTTSSRACRARW